MLAKVMNLFNQKAIQYQYFLNLILSLLQSICLCFHCFHLCTYSWLFTQCLTTKRYLEIVMDEISSTLLIKLYEYPLYIDAKGEMSTLHTSRKIVFVVGSKKLFSSIFYLTLTQETLNQTSV